MATNFFELATTLKNLGAKWLSEKKMNFTPCIKSLKADVSSISPLSDAHSKSWLIARQNI